MKNQRSSLDMTRCQYASKPCANHRSLKPDGSPHRLCTLHREKAKQAQRRWHERQRSEAARRRPMTDATPKRQRIEPLTLADCGSPTMAATCQLNVDHGRIDSPVSVEYGWSTTTAMRPFDTIDWGVPVSLAADDACVEFDDFLKDWSDWCPLEACIF